MDSLCENGASSPVVSKPALLLMRITGGTSAILSVFGASLIIFTYVAFKKLRTTARQLLVNLSVADIVISLSHFVGLLAKYETYLHPDDKYQNASTSPLCSTQAAFTAFGTVASYCWSMLIAVYMLFLTQSRSATPRKILVPIIYLISWGIPIVIVIVIAATDYLGYNPQDTPGQYGRSASELCFPSPPAFHPYIF